MNAEHERRNGGERRQYDRAIPIWMERGVHRDCRILEMTEEKMTDFSLLIFEPKNLTFAVINCIF